MNLGFYRGGISISVSWHWRDKWSYSEYLAKYTWLLAELHGITFRKHREAPIAMYKLIQAAGGGIFRSASIKSEIDTAFTWCKTHASPLICPCARSLCIFSICFLFSWRVPRNGTALHIADLNFNIIFFETSLPGRVSLIFSAKYLAEGSRQCSAEAELPRELNRESGLPSDSLRSNPRPTRSDFYRGHVPEIRLEPRGEDSAFQRNADPVYWCNQWRHSPVRNLRAYVRAQIGREYFHPINGAPAAKYERTPRVARISRRRRVSFHGVKCQRQRFLLCRGITARRYVER